MWFPHPCILLEQMPEALSVLLQVAITKNRNQTHLRWNAFVPASHTACFTVEKLQNIFHLAKNYRWAQWHQVCPLNISFHHTLTITHRFRACFFTLLTKSLTVDYWTESLKSAGLSWYVSSSPRCRHCCVVSGAARTHAAADGMSPPLCFPYGWLKLFHVFMLAERICQQQLNILLGDVCQSWQLSIKHPLREQACTQFSCWVRESSPFSMLNGGNIERVCIVFTVPFVPPKWMLPQHLQYIWRVNHLLLWGVTIL